ncbi:SDR family oxidoreductase [Siccirubricoccus sp. KC 17139]|uniref:SDR family oxidoreductase n=1 Tax=Siccirubricoccus soli TaxID=2899147 RepID=A0ABT1D6J2_9PROT|nr:SDR family oxidoreductase [Siccirubricoccus soli]MCO6417549.1 SDR family oxidoreductase [Siccirubricoccus soli]MCP2683684.1 SDR family oxidoreductase [Siccirubricoccus soli]
MSVASQEFRNRRLLIVGGGSGIGAATVALAAARGATLAVSVLDEAEAAALTAAHPGIAVQKLDLREREMVAPVLGGLIAGMGGVDAVVYSAGIMIRTAAAEMPDADWDRLMEINLTGGFRVLREVLPALEASPSLPAAVIVSSQLGTVGFRAGAAYAASKFGLNGLVASIALEYAPRGVRVNAVGPGPTETPLTAASRADPKIFAEMVGNIPMGRYGKPEEIAEVILFLASTRASFVTGQCWCVDGGYVAK